MLTIELFGHGKSNTSHLMDQFGVRVRQRIQSHKLVDDRPVDGNGFEDRYGVVTMQILAEGEFYRIELFDRDH